MKFLNFIIILILCLLYGLIKHDLTAIYFSDSEFAFIGVYAAFDFIFGFITPLIILAFLVVSIKLMFLFFDDNIQGRRLLADLSIMLIVPCVLMTFVYFIVTSISQAELSYIIANPQDASSIKSILDIPFSVVIPLSIIATIFIYISAIYILIKKQNKPVIKAIFSTILPTIIVYLTYLLF